MEAMSFHSTNLARLEKWRHTTVSGHGRVMLPVLNPSRRANPAPPTTSPAIW
jgi:hypothetical protein